jgi:CDP-diacylglycerol--serine O-phosphatidyltransferase
MLGFYNYTVIATYLSVASASVGIWFVLEGKPTAAVFCLLSCGILDMFDGKIARTLKTRTPDEKRFGIQIDSLSDILAFGVLPAAIGFSVFGNSVLFLILAVIYVLAALIRLAYFNVTEETRQDKTDEVRKFFTGLPVTTASFTFPAIWCFSAPAGGALKYIFAALMLAHAILFVSTLKIPKAHGKAFAAISVAGVLLFALLIAASIAGWTL